ncbi:MULTISPECIES: IS200/IS605 family transposase [Emticicia]|jgi:REP element-mobilizing transposase RayT|uniref:IS200/IS605 family transposase n=1 Tax=Emticicia TaxID=312278 RepID=UPI0007D8B71E|nr:MULTISPECIES: IS200/IS605 family transposase [Emticicia]
MANTFTQIHLHLIFAVKFRQNLIQREWKDKLYKYTTGIIQNNGHKVLIINGMSDHIHILIGFRSTQTLADLMRDIKQMTSLWINENKLTKSKFAWQEGYAAFSYGQSQLPIIIKYIENQEEHHRKRTFLEEYKEFLNLFEVSFDEKYIFKEPE